MLKFLSLLGAGTAAGGRYVKVFELIGAGTAAGGGYVGAGTTAGADVLNCYVVGFMFLSKRLCLGNFSHAMGISRIVYSS